MVFFRTHTHTPADALLLLLFPYHYVNAYIIAAMVYLQYNIRRTALVLFSSVSYLFLFFDYNRFGRNGLVFFFIFHLFVPVHRSPWHRRAFNGLKTTREHNGIPEPRARLMSVYRHRGNVFTPSPADDKLLPLLYTY